ncbi:MCE family protein [Candidatus Desantisbacteria bacterium]|nr:MCE family protein [Candidatus Desantisbacteria bacterium]
MHQELKIGILVAAAIVIAGIMITLAGGRSFYRQGYQIRVHFDYISGLDTGAPVRLAGMEIGEVRDLQLIDNKIEATIWVESSAKIHSDARVTINSLGIIGEKYIEITLGKKGRLLKNGDSLIGENPVNVEEVLMRGERIVKMLDYQVKFLERLMFNSQIPWDAIADIVRNVSEITKDTNNLIKTNKDDVTSSIQNFNKLSTTLEKTVDENKDELRNVTGELKKATKNLNAAVLNTEKNLNTAILNTDKGLSKSLTEFSTAASNFSNICKKIDEGNGSLGRIIKDRKIADDLSETTNNLKLLSEDLRQHPWKIIQPKKEEKQPKR